MVFCSECNLSQLFALFVDVKTDNSSALIVFGDGIFLQYRAWIKVTYIKTGKNHSGR